MSRVVKTYLHSFTYIILYNLQFGQPGII